MSGSEKIKKEEHLLVNNEESEYKINNIIDLVNINKINGLHGKNILKCINELRDHINGKVSQKSELNNFFDNLIKLKSPDELSEVNLILESVLSKLNDNAEEDSEEK